MRLTANFGELPEVLEIQDPLPQIPAGHRVLMAHKAMPAISDTILLIEGAESLQNELRQLAEDRDVAPRVIFPGLLFSIDDIETCAEKVNRTLTNQVPAGRGTPEQCAAAVSKTLCLETAAAEPVYRRATNYFLKPMQGLL